MFYYDLHFTGEARKRFKTCVNILSTIKNENNEKYLILRKKYMNEIPDQNRSGGFDSPDKSANKPSDSDQDLDVSYSDNKFVSEPLARPPPYKAPPSVLTHNQNYGLCVDEFKHALNSVDIGSKSEFSQEKIAIVEDSVPKPKPVISENRENRENQAIESVNDENHLKEDDDFNTKVDSQKSGNFQDNPISVKEATRKFNRIASQEDPIKILSPTNQNHNHNHHKRNDNKGEIKV